MSLVSKLLLLELLLLLLLLQLHLMILGSLSLHFGTVEKVLA